MDMYRPLWICPQPKNIKICCQGSYKPIMLSHSKDGSKPFRIPQSTRCEYWHSGVTSSVTCVLKTQLGELQLGKLHDDIKWLDSVHSSHLAKPLYTSNLPVKSVCRRLLVANLCRFSLSLTGASPNSPQQHHSKSWTLPWQRQAECFRPLHGRSVDTCISLAWNDWGWFTSHVKSYLYVSLHQYVSVHIHINIHKHIFIYTLYTVLTSILQPPFLYAHSIGDIGVWKLWNKWPTYPSLTPEWNEHWVERKLAQLIRVLKLKNIQKTWWFPVLLKMI